MSYLEKVIEGLTHKPKITVSRLNEQGEEIPSNIQPETSHDLIAMSIRDLKVIQQDMRSHLDVMRRNRANETMILQVEQEIDLIDGVLERLARAAGMAT